MDIGNLLQTSCTSNIDNQSGNLLFLLLNTLLASQCTLKNPNNYPKDQGQNIKDGDHFDFIVVGAGTSGSVVASTLAKQEKWKVLVLEAGGLPSVTSEIPLLAENTIKLKDTRMYSTEPSKDSCLGMKKGACYWPRGQVLGGSSAINSMIYIRGNKNNYDTWQKLGNEGWGFEDIQKHFKKIENLNKPIQSYGQQGLLPLTKYSANETLRDLIFESVKEMGFEVLEEDGKLGFLEAPLNTDGKVRANIAKVFLGSAKHLETLTLALDAHVSKIILNLEKKQAEGVEVTIGNRKLKLYADKEVIISSGALNSPQLLMLSGIGPKNHLETFGIEVIQDLPVGRNLEDHLMFIMYSRVSDEAIKTKTEGEIMDDIYRYFAHGEGDLSTISITNIQGFINTKNDSEFPDVQLNYAAIPKGDTFFEQTYMENLNINDETAKKIVEYSKNHNILMSIVILSQPKSRGEILLKSSDPSDNVKIKTGYLTDTHGEDLETVLKGIRFAQAQLKTSAFQKVNPVVLDTAPNCQDMEFDSDDYWQCAVRSFGTTVYHPTSTCKMGKNDGTSVVNSRLKVHGVDKLRVVDASIMPNVISGNTNAPCIMIGSKGAEIIIDDYREGHTEL